MRKTVLIREELSVQDITMHSDRELALIVYNDEYLYRMRKTFLKDQSVLDEMFKFTDDQLMELVSDILVEDAC